MKKTTLIFLLMLSCKAMFGQFSNYVWMNPFPQANNLESVFFLNNSFGWAVGQDGAVVHTLNAGANWVYEHVPGTGNLNDLFFVNESQGWIVGDGGKVYQTINGGQDWTAVAVPTTQDLKSVYFINAYIGWIVGGDNVVLRTVDHGASWQLLSSTPGSGTAIKKVRFTDFNQGWVVGYNVAGNNGGMVMKTTDGGVTWTTKYTSSLPITGLTFPAQDTVVVCGSSGLLLRTTDNGQNWGALAPGLTNDMKDISFYGTDYGFAVMLPNQGNQHNLMHTQDGGITWDTTLVGWKDVPLNALSLLDPGHIFAAGDGGVMFLSADAGATWSEMSAGNHANLYAADFVDSHKGWVAGGNATPVVLRTTDTGWDWTTLDLPQWNDHLTDITFFGQNIGVVVGANGSILSTPNGGQRWDSLSYGRYPGLKRVHIFSDTNSILVIGSGGRILRSKNRGVNWDSIPSGNRWMLSDMCFQGTANGWIAGHDSTVLLKTTDNGHSWATIHTGFTGGFYSVAFPDSLHGSIGCRQGRVLHTVDGGLTWQEQQTGVSGTVDHLRFFDHLRGTGTAGHDRILTTDGGATWQTDPIGYGQLATGVYFLDLHTCYITGERGMVLHYSDAFSGIQEITDALGMLKVYPNPAETTLHIVLPNTLNPGNKYSIRIVDMMGRVAGEFNLTPQGDLLTLPVSSLTCGLYLLQVNGLEGVSGRARVQVQR